MTIIESRPHDLIRINLEFFRPFAATNLAEFTFRPAGDQTAVTWSMTGKNNFIAKAIHLFMNMDKLPGRDLETSLLTLKKVLEKNND